MSNLSDFVGGGGGGGGVSLPIGTPDWPVTLDYNTEGDLSEAVYAQGTDRYRQSLTYNADGELATVLYEESSNSGTTYTEIGVETLNYDAEGNLTHTEWIGA